MAIGVVREHNDVPYDPSRLCEAEKINKFIFLILGYAWYPSIIN